jgi:hypothetical protein
VPVLARNVGRLALLGVSTALAMGLLVGPAAALTPARSCSMGETRSGRPLFEGDLAEWMTCMFPRGSTQSRSTALDTLLIPGSNGAGTNALFDAEASTFHYVARCPSPIDAAAKGLNWVTRQWSMAQTRSTADQAATGSRWFELRGLLDNYLWRSCDGLVTDRWFDVFNDVATFSNQHPGEVLVVDMAQLLDPITDVSALRLSEALAPLCRKAVGPAQAPEAHGRPGSITIEEARAAGGVVLLLSDDPESQRAYVAMTRWLAAHPTDPCNGKLWSRSGTRVSTDTSRDANLWRNRHHLARAAASMAQWATRQPSNQPGEFGVTRMTWDYTGPAKRMRYQIWLMNHWLIDYNSALDRTTRDLARALWHTSCRSSGSPHVILMDNLAKQRPMRELIAINRAPCGAGNH